MNTENEYELAEKVLNKVMPKSIDSESKLKQMLN